MELKNIVYLFICIICIGQTTLCADWKNAQDDFSKEIFKIDFENGKIEAKNWGPKKIQVVELRREYGIFQCNHQVWMFAFYREEGVLRFRVICMNIPIFVSVHSSILSSQNRSHVFSELKSDICILFKMISDIAMLSENPLFKTNANAKNIRLKIKQSLILVQILKQHTAETHSYKYSKVVEKLLLTLSLIISHGDLFKEIDLMLRNCDLIISYCDRIGKSLNDRLPVSSSKPHLRERIEKVVRMYRDISFCNRFELLSQKCDRIEHFAKLLDEVIAQCSYSSSCGQDLHKVRKKVDCLHKRLLRFPDMMTKRGWEIAEKAGEIMITAFLTTIDPVIADLVEKCKLK